MVTEIVQWGRKSAQRKANVQERRWLKPEAGTHGIRRKGADFKHPTDIHVLSTNNCTTRLVVRGLRLQNRQETVPVAPIHSHLSLPSRDPSRVIATHATCIGTCTLPFARDCRCTLFALSSLQFGLPPDSSAPPPSKSSLPVPHIQLPRLPLLTTSFTSLFMLSGASSSLARSLRHFYAPQHGGDTVGCCRGHLLLHRPSRCRTLCRRGPDMCVWQQTGYPPALRYRWLRTNRHKSRRSASPTADPMSDLGAET